MADKNDIDFYFFYFLRSFILGHVNKSLLMITYVKTEAILR